MIDGNLGNLGGNDAAPKNMSGVKGDNKKIALKGVSSASVGALLIFETTLNPELPGACPSNSTARRPEICSSQFNIGSTLARSALLASAKA